MKINIKMATDETIETLKLNIKKVTQFIMMNKQNNGWISNLLPKNPFEIKKYIIDDFDLKISEKGDYKEVEYENSILLYEHLKDVPMYILTDEKFWLWIYLEKFYKIAVQSMPINSESTILDHWLFTQGQRRGLFFGVLSRSFFRVFLSVDETLQDKYELTKYVIENPERFRNLTWRAYSSQKHIVLGALKAQKSAELKHKDLFKTKFYNVIAKRIARLGSVKLLDAITEEEIYNEVSLSISNLIEGNDTL